MKHVSRCVVFVDSGEFVLCTHGSVHCLMEKGGTRFYIIIENEISEVKILNNRNKGGKKSIRKRKKNEKKILNEKQQLLNEKKLLNEKNEIMKKRKILGKNQKHESRKRRNVERIKKNQKRNKWN